MRTQSRIHIGAVTLFAAPVVAQPLTSIDVPEGCTRSGAMDVSADGRVVAAYADSGPSSSRRAYRWTREGGFEPITPAGVRQMPIAISADGTTVVGHDLWRSGFVSTPQHGYTPLGDFDFGPWAVAYGVSGDGGVVVGRMEDVGPGNYERAMRWLREPGTFVDLGVLPNHLNSAANAVSADGAVICGVSWPDVNYPQYSVVRWTDAGMEDLGMLPGHQFSWAVSISRDGSTIVGFSHSPVPGMEHPVRWREGIIEPLAFPARSNRGAIAYRANWDGVVLVGVTHYENGSESPVRRAALWAPYVGAVDLNDYLPTIGIDTTGWVLDVAQGVSADGRTIVGEGTLHGQARGFILTLPPHCGTADFNSDGDSGTDADIEAFFLCLGGSCCPTCGTADFNADGDTGTDADIESFFRVLAGGSC